MKEVTFKSLGKGCRIVNPRMITGAHNIVIEDNVHIQDGAIIRGDGGLLIGANTHIARDVRIYTINHDWHQRVPYGDKDLERSVVIGQNVWIGIDCCVAPGASIGEGVIVGMNTTVYGTVPALAIIAAAPWHIVKWRTPGEYFDHVAKGNVGGAGGRPLS